MPRGVRKQKSIISTGDLQSGQNIGVTLTEIGGGVAVTKDDIQIVQPAQMLSMAQQEKFMNEFVEIQIQPDDDPNAPEFIPAGHNGTMQYIHRGTVQRIRRKYLYALVAAKKTQFACSFGKDNSGNEFNRMSAKSNNTFRLSIITDSKEGQEHFRQWMKEA